VSERDILLIQEIENTSSGYFNPKPKYDHLEDHECKGWRAKYLRLEVLYTGKFQVVSITRIQVMF